MRGGMDSRTFRYRRIRFESKRVRLRLIIVSSRAATVDNVLVRVSKYTGKLLSNRFRFLLADGDLARWAYIDLFQWRLANYN